MRKTRASLWATFGAASVAMPNVANAAEAYLRVVDVGNAMCVVALTPSGHSMLYDAGNYNTSECAAAVAEIIGDRKLDLIVLSHSDADHIGEVPEILKANGAKVLVYTGAAGTSKKAWPEAFAAIVEAEDKKKKKPKADRLGVRNLADRALPNTIDPKPGKARAKPLVIKLGDATATFVAGWPRWPYPGDAGAKPSDSELRNVISIVVKFEYGGKSALLTGDTIGRRGRVSEAPTAFRDAERWMVERGNVPLKSDVLIGQHHGGDNSSSSRFIEAVDPRFVVFPAGVGHKHPRATTAQRYLDRPIPAERIFRTDRGDDEPEDLEWEEGLEIGCVDQTGDDDVEIFLSNVPNSDVRARYRHDQLPCVPA